MQVTKNITLDLLETGSPVIIKAKQNDRNTRYIAAHLYVDGLAYPVPSGTEIAFRYKKPDGTAGFYDALPDNSPAITISGNTVTVELVEQVLTVSGCVHCEINMYNAASEKLTTFTFEISVEESVLTDAEIISSDYYNVLTAEIAKALQAVTDATEQAENAAQSAQDAADNAAMSKDWAAGQPVTYSGTTVSIAYAGENRIASITAYGENAQGGTTEAPVALTGVDSVQVCGKNMLPNKTKTNTVAGITYTVNPDKSVTAKGTATSWSNIVIDADFSLPAGTYTLNSNIQTAGVNLVIGKDATGKKNIAVSSTASKTFTLSDSIKHCVAYIAVAPDSVVDTTIRPMLNLGKTAMPYEPYQGNVTQLPIPRPLRRVGDVRDVCVTRQEYEGTEKLVVTYNVGYIASYAGESITTAWISSTGALSTGAEVAYVLSSPETYATDPIDFDNAAGPLTVMTGGEVEVRMTELVGNREFTERLSYIGNPNLLDNSNFTNPVNQRDGTSYSASTGNAAYAIDRWRIEGATYTVATHTLSGTSYTNRACRMAQFIEMAQYGLNIGDDMTFSIMANGTKHSATAKILDRDQYSSFENVPSAYSCDDFDIVLCTGLGKPSILSFTICAKKSLVLEWAKLEKGSVATPYVHKSYGAELSACQRYFYYLDATKWYACYQITGWGLIIPIDLPVPMRAQPTANTVGEVKVFTPSGWVNATSVSTNQFNRDKARINIVLTMPSGSMDSYEGRAMVATGIESLSADL